MITEQKMYGVKCDNCGKDYEGYNGYIAMNDKESMREDALECDWHNEDDKDYCDKCHSFDDEDQLVIKPLDNNNGRR